MASAFDALTHEQKADFRQQLTRLGLAHDALSHDGVLDTGQRDGPTILSTVPAQSHVPPRLIPVANIAELTQFFGVRDSESAETDSGIVYPPPLVQTRLHALAPVTDVVELAQQMSDEELVNLRLAAEAFVLGNSAKVKSYEPLLNTFFFPGNVAAFVFDAIEVKPGSPLVLSSPDPNGTITLNAASITLHPGAEIQVWCQAELRTQITTGDSKIVFPNKPGDDGKQGEPPPQKAQTGNSWQAGRSHYDGGNCRDVCDGGMQPPGNGHDGSQGPRGGNATPGLPSNPGVAHLGTVTGVVTIQTGGGKGGKGGKGGTGGPGGDPGPNGDYAKGCGGRPPDAVGGLGGQGGPGGPGGAGGGAGTVIIYYTSLAPGAGFIPDARSGEIGKGGDGGDPGPPGPRRTGDKGKGPTGPDGTPAGAVGQILIRLES